MKKSWKFPVVLCAICLLAGCGAANACEEGKDTAGMVAAASGQNRDAEKEALSDVLATNTGNESTSDELTANNAEASQKEELPYDYYGYIRARAKADYEVEYVETKESRYDFSVTGEGGIPDGLLQIIGEIVKERALKEFEWQNAQGREISRKELMELPLPYEYETANGSKKGMTLGEELSGNQSGSASAIMVDADGDGIEDVLVQYYWGGSGQGCELLFFKGASDGSYLLTDRRQDYLAGECFCEYDGTVYYVRSLWNFTTISFDGAEIVLFRDGKAACDALVKYRVKEYIPDVRPAYHLADEEYFPAADFLEQIAEESDYDDILDFEKLVAWNFKGDAETEADAENRMLKSDFDNDGKEDYYAKRFWYTSNGFPSGGYLEFADEAVKTKFSLVEEEVHRTISNWNRSLLYYNLQVIKTDSGNVLALYYLEEGTYDYTVFYFRMK